MNEYEEYNVQIKDSAGDEKFPEDVVIIPIMNSPIFPGMIAPIILTEDKFTAELDEYLIKSGYLALNLVKNDLKNEEGEIDPTIQEDLDSREITSKDIYKVGVLCKVVKRLKLPDGSVNVLVHGIKRYRASNIYEQSPLLRAKYEVFDDILEEDEELDAYTRSIINQVKKLSEVNAYFNEEMKLAMINSSSPGALADLVAFALSLDIPEAQDFLETLVVKKRFGKLLVYLKREKDVADIQKKISDEVNDKVNKYQREYFLREQLKVIKSELGLEEDDKARDISKLKERVLEAKLPEEVLQSVNEELERLEVIPDSSPEYNVTRTYLNWIVDLPWSKSTDDYVDMDKAQKILEKEHYGLEKAKERIMEFLAVRKLKPQFDGTILCLAGPPGVGKTSMGKSIAESLGRKFYRFSLGGMRDEAEIKGHRRTYVGAMPGRLIQAMKRVEVNNPVIMLDEIDKLGQSFQGDPASALLEVLDPEQNHTFIDHYLDVPFDLSKVLFISTANYIGDIPEPLLDRMEIIELSGYTMEEKLSIASKWVIPKQIKKHGLEKKDISLSKATLKKLIEDYAREPGVRVMEQMIAKMCRRAALEKVKAKRHKVFNPKPTELEDILGTARYQSEKALKKLCPGMTTGLAWTGYGGDILYIETLSLNGKGFKLTGQLGDVMNESANLAYSYVKQLLQNEMDEYFKMKPKRKVSDENEEDEMEDFLSEREVHLHLPAGATPKDGPSAGITMALALYSLAHNVTIKSNLAMTGELSLTGKVLPVGGIKEKVLAAKRAGITNIILPIDNEKDLKEVPERHRKGMKFYPVAHFDEVLKIAIPKFKPKFK
ncbi:endopeptidase La [Halobacteriovorax sp. XZX-3]|uniref:endopeptidase La n=1 Tax=unclassified Halobacteriovorax TaxID=2639665 RepID=UPI000CD2A612|nr:endopeptidase La [Halobacteriovorax sp. DA5]POB13067.1 endopeptidase La [Halobacteriovorax sp. DA5]